MRILTHVNRGRVLAMLASVLLSGSALAAAVMPAQGASAAAAANTVAVTSPGNQVSMPGTPVDVEVSATETDATATLTFSVTGLPAEPAGDAFAISQPAAGDATVDITGTFAEPFTGTVVVTATDAASGATDSVEFTWTAEAGADNPVTITGPGAEQSAVGAAITAVEVTGDDSTAGAALSYAATSTDPATGKTIAGPPPGLAIDATTGAVTGTPTGIAARYIVIVTASDGTGAAADVAIAWSIGNKITVTAAAKPPIYLGVPVDIVPKGVDSDPTQTLTWTWAAASTSGLPAGLKINASTGVISGRDTDVTTTKFDYPVKITATDTADSAGSVTVTIVLGVPIPIAGHEGTSVTTTAGHGVDLVFSYSDVIKNDKVTLSATGLPAGVTFQASPPVIWGWPTTAGTYTVVIHANGSSGATDIKTFKLVVKPAPDSGATGSVKLSLGGKCLQDPGGKTKNGTAVVLSNCVSGSTERWTVASDGTIRVNGRCLDVDGSGGFSGRGVELWQCTGGARQTWTQGTDGELISTGSGLCLADAKSGTENGTVPALAACHVRSSEQWTLPAQSILAAEGGYCADDYHSLGYDNSIVDMYQCNSTPGQAWDFGTDGTIRQSQYTNKCLTVHGPLGKAGVKITLWLCQGGDKEQEWSVVKAGGLRSELTLDGVCLGIPTLAGEDTDQLVTAKCGTAPALWHIW